MKNKYASFFCLCYLLLAIFFLLLNVIKPNLIQVIALIISIPIIILFLKKPFKLNKILIIILFLIAIIIRIILFFKSYGSLESDYLFFYNSAVSLSNGLELNVDYISSFPFLYYYIFLLSLMFKLFSTHYIIVILLNVIFELISIFFLYLFIKNKYDKQSAINMVLIYLLNPFSILWLIECSPVIIINTFLIITIYFFSNININNKYIIPSILTGVFMGLTNVFRPIMIIFVLTIIIYYVYLIIDKNNYKKLLISFGLIIICFFGINNLALWNTKNVLKVDKLSNSGAFSILVGSNLESKGMWNKKDADTYYEYVEKYGIDKAREKSIKIAINRYKSYGLKSAKLIGLKSAITGRNVDKYTIHETESITSINIITKFYTSLFYYVILILNIIVAFKIFKNKELHKNNILSIFIIGLFTSMLLVESSARYFLPILTVIIIFILINNEKNVKNLDKKR